MVGVNGPLPVPVACHSFGGAILRLYQTLVLRDLLATSVPGAISFLCLWYLVGRSPDERFLLWLSRRFETGVSLSGAIAFLAISYLVAWALVAIHSGLADWVFELFRGHGRLRRRLFWPLFGLARYVRTVAELGPENEEDESEESSEKASEALISRASLASAHVPPDSASGPARPMSRSPESPYPLAPFHRMLLLNLALAGVPLLIAGGAGGFGWWALLGAPLVLLLYLEFWRLWHLEKLEVDHSEREGKPK